MDLLLFFDCFDLLHPGKICLDWQLFVHLMVYLDLVLLKLIF